MYQIFYDKPALKDLKKIDKTSARFLLTSLKEFADNFNDTYEAQLFKTQKIKKLKGQNQDLYRLKLRTYRAIYQKQAGKLVILVVSVKHRSGVYEKY